MAQPHRFRVRTSFSRLLKPFDAFFRIEAASGLLLLLATAAALVLANGPFGGSYDALWHAAAAIGGLEISAHFVVNDVLMTLFFFVVGLEIRREMHSGALSSLRAAALPVVAAFGGILVPALVYLALNAATDARDGWAIPIATDIAFAVGVLTLLGRNVPTALRALLLSLAIADDLAAIAVIAVFYANGIELGSLALAATGIACFVLAPRVPTALRYAVAGSMIWAGLLAAGIHPVLAGVTLGLLTPAGGGERSAAVRLERALHPYVAYAVMPLFALANAGVDIGGVAFDATTTPMAAGIVLGLVLGKPLGIGLAVLLAVKTRLCTLPAGVDWRGVVLLGALGGIGFTMSVLVATLAFEDAALLAAAKLAVLAASALAATLAFVLGRFVRRAR